MRNPAAFAGSVIPCVEGFGVEMVMLGHSRFRRRQACFWLVLLTAALLLGPGFLRAAWDGSPIFSTASAGLLPGKVSPPAEGSLSGGGFELPAGRGLPGAAGVSGEADSQMPNGEQTGRPGGSASPPAEDHAPSTDVNPVTGMAVASSVGYTKLTLDERWKLYLKMTYASAGPYFSPFVNALALDQANGTPRQWGGGFPGFGRRLASRMGNAVLQGSFQAPLAALLHEDVRYITTRERSIPRRALHAILYSFLTYNDDGHPTLNIANLAAFYASTAVTATWLPGISNPAKYTFTNASEQIAVSFPLNVVQEFWPEIRQHLFRKH